MEIRCPSCGAQMSLDTIIDNDAAAQALQLALSITPLGKMLVRYIALFRPASRKLSWSRVAALLGELMPAIEAQRIERDGKVYDAPHDVWCAAIEQMLVARDNGKLQLPMKSHGYLFEIIVTEGARTQARGTDLAAHQHNVVVPNTPRSGTAQAVMALEQRKRRSHSS